MTNFKEKGTARSQPWGDREQSFRAGQDRSLAGLPNQRRAAWHPLTAEDLTTVPPITKHIFRKWGKHEMVAALLALAKRVFIRRKKTVSSSATSKVLPFRVPGKFLQLLICVALATCAFGRNADPKAGMKAFWTKGCIRCHPVLGEGDKVGPDLSRSPSTADGYELAAAMWSHAPQMWQRMSQDNVQLPTFQLEEMEDLFAFLAMARSFDEPGNATEGMQLFQAKRCVECHSIRGQGGKVGPDLATVASNRNPVAWVTAMWNHAPGMFRALANKGVPFPRFERSEMVDLESYIRVQAGATNQQIYLRPANADQGAALFQSKQCIRCHSIGGRGGKVGPDLSRATLPRRYGEIAVVMWNHAPQMERLVAAQAIPYPKFEPQELADVLSYLNSLTLNRPGNAAAGAETFAAKGCSACHATTSGGSGLGPNLTHLQQSLTPVSIARTMWNHGPAMLQRMEKSAIIWPTFNSRELADTLAFLESIQARSQQISQSKTPGSKP